MQMILIPIFSIFEEEINVFFFGLSAFLPASQEWKEGNLLPIGLVFEHRLNPKNDPGVYADIIVTKDIAEQIEVIKLTSLKLKF